MHCCLGCIGARRSRPSGEIEVGLPAGCDSVTKSSADGSHDELDVRVLDLCFTRQVDVYQGVRWHPWFLGTRLSEDCASGGRVARSSRGAATNAVTALQAFFTNVWRSAAKS